MEPLGEDPKNLHFILSFSWKYLNISQIQAWNVTLMQTYQLAVQISYVPSFCLP